MIQEMTKSPKSVMEAERGEFDCAFVIILLCSVVGIRELVKGPLNCSMLSVLEGKHATCCLQLQMIKKQE